MWPEKANCGNEVLAFFCKCDQGGQKKSKKDTPDAVSIKGH